MPRVAKQRRLLRRARLERRLEWLEKFWGPDWQAQRQAYLRTRHVKPGMPRQLARSIRRARRGPAPRVEWYESAEVSFAGQVLPPC